MTVEFKLPDLGEGIDEADILEVLVREGDSVAVDQAVLTIETEKATIDVPASAAGTVSKVHVAPGDTVRPGQLLITFEEAGAQAVAPEATSSGAAQSAAPSEAAPAPSTSEPRAETREPAEAPVEETRAELSLERPEAEAAAVEAAPTSAAAEPTPPNGGKAGEGGSPQPRTPPPPTDGAPAFASPSVRQFAREIGVDIRDVLGSGPGGRIDEEDVKRHARERPTRAASQAQTAETPATSAAATPPATQPALPDFAQFGHIDREPLSRFRRTVARNMTTSWTGIPHVTLFDTADVTELEEVRRRYRDRAREAGGNLTLSVVLLKIVAAALKANPRFNSSIDLDTNELILKRYYHIGMAVDTERGLAVPVIRDVDEKNIIELAVEMNGIAERARENKLTLDEMRGATFTISNLGSLGTGHFTPLVNWPEVALLGVGRAEQTPVYTDGQWQPRLQLPLSLSIDHRVVDGADGARFLNWIIEAIREPLVLAMEG
jgi:pyruvate dehydrogenase E2 component (dihydrolipoamide acetyltransferase)